MDFYALNVVPINGWATAYGGAEADLSLAATGKSAHVLLGGADVDMSLGATGNGTRWTFGSSADDLELDVAGSGTRWTFGTGDADLDIEGGGDGKVTQTLGGTATLLLTWPEALGGVLRHGSANAALELSAIGDGRAAVGRFGESFALMYMLTAAEGREVRPKHGRGLIEMWLDVIGKSRLVTDNGGEADLRLLAAGAGRVGEHLFGGGVAQMSFDILHASARQYRQVNGAADIGFTFMLDARDQRIAVLPSNFYQAPNARGMFASRDSRGMRVAAAERTYEIAEA